MRIINITWSAHEKVINGQLPFICKIIHNLQKSHKMHLSSSQSVKKGNDRSSISLYTYVFTYFSQWNRNEKEKSERKKDYMLRKLMFVLLMKHFSFKFCSCFTNLSITSWGTNREWAVAVQEYSINTKEKTDMAGQPRVAEKSLYSCLLTRKIIAFTNYVRRT